MKDKKLLAIFAMQRSDELSAYTLNKLSEEKKKEIKEFWDSVPKLEKPYTRLWQEIQTRKRIHNQSNWGPEKCPQEANVCGTAMCTAGHLVNMAGARGYELKQEFGWARAASIIHQKSCPDLPEQNYGSIPQEWALAYIEEMAEREKI